MASMQILWSCNQVNHKGNSKHPYMKSTKIITRKRYNLIRFEGGVVQNFDQEKRKLRVLIAGGGIGGLVLALAAKHRGYEVKVFEKDLSAIRGEGRHRGPIQLMSSALSVLEAIDESVVKKIMEVGCVTGNRINGLADGVSGEWFTELDLLTPASRKGLPLTLVICRMTLQDILVNAIGSNILKNKSKVVDFIQEPSKVRVVLENGQHYDGDILVGADGIWSEVRSKLFGWQEAKYSGVTCYSGLTNYVPPYINTIGYRVFLGLNQYFVASDVGYGKMQWYAFHGEPPSRGHFPEGKKKKLMDLFGNWCNEVKTLISETPENMILQRDIYDRDIINTWGIGRVTLLGDAAHPMQPNLGLGGCMAIEDCYQLILELDKVGSGFEESQVTSALRRYEKKRIPRVRVLHTASRMASKMLVNYRPYIQFQLWPHSKLTDMQIKHPGVHVARALLKFTLPQFVNWMISGHGLW
ncbi:zeaxanthin epoxidase, chloroplastic isoform X3 [Medicago truncatula]|uniref:Antheraxanthin epoxidase/zeaxanthin epoxidase n=1 Tax=Medicago truncatula TaxID=3880 RepID=G7JVQ7_MEDTR|nr:zeaxanthin epoxidase, chloroplastic isoform X3 [Medicago truncatula]AES87209.1 antheraxanthin epoxidase/zeaxanthin epoxidase [Medicago truncatula]